MVRSHSFLMAASRGAQPLVKGVAKTMGRQNSKRMLSSSRSSCSRMASCKILAIQSPHRVSDQLLQLPSNTAPRHWHTVNK